MIGECILFGDFLFVRQTKSKLRSLHTRVSTMRVTSWPFVVPPASGSVRSTDVLRLSDEQLEGGKMLPVCEFSRDKCTGTWASRFWLGPEGVYACQVGIFVDGRYE